MSTIRTLAIAAVMLTLAGSPAAVAQGVCMSGQDPNVRALLASGQVATFPQALQRAGIPADQVAGDPQLCATPSGYEYRVTVVRGGQVTPMSIPANR
jgi:hypothetical protein